MSAAADSAAVSRSTPGGEELVFALASCQYPAGILDETMAQASYRRLAQRLESADDKAKPSFLLLVGDQIYADATAGLFDPTARFDRFERPYDVLQDVFTKLNIRLPLYMMLDDHEIADNWEPLGCGATDPMLSAGREAYLRQRLSLFGPDQVPPVRDSTEPLWFKLEKQGFPLFISDTRTERGARTAATIESARIMSEAQFDALCAWLGKEAEKNPELPKFIASPSILLPRRLRAARGHAAAALRSDAWDGYPASLHALLAHIAQNEIRNVVFLSGDEHLSCVAKIDVTAPGKMPIRIVSVHSSALYAPFPFANSVEADLAGDDRFEFPPNGPLKYRCKVTTTFVSGDGFAVIRVAHNGGNWIVDCEFDRSARAGQVLPVLP